MILGLGTDVVQVKRFNSWVDNRNLMARFFSDDELGWCQKHATNMSASLAARFAAKEAFGKALGTGLAGFKLRDVSVLRTSKGRPSIVLVESAQKAFDDFMQTIGIACSTIHLSMSHETDYAVATVIIEG